MDASVYHMLQSNLLNMDNKETEIWDYSEVAHYYW